MRVGIELEQRPVISQKCARKQIPFSEQMKLLVRISGFETIRQFFVLGIPHIFFRRKIRALS